jgi:DNA-binding transcriptional LysR family regulator
LLNIHQLSIFLAVADARSYTQAARRLHLTQPAVSHQVKGLEKQLGLRLFQRKGQRMELTEAGRALLPAAQQLVDFINRAEASIQRLQYPMPGTLHIGCGTDAGEYVIPKLIGAFRRENPDININVKTGDCTTVLRSLQDMEIDVGLVGFRPRGKGLQSRKLFNDHMVLIVPARHPWAKRESVAPEELRQATLIVRQDGSGLHQTILEGLERHGVSWDELRVFMEVGGTGLVELAVGAGLGVSLISSLAARRYPGRIRAIRIDGLNLACEVYMVRNLHQVASHANLKFWEFIQSPRAAELISQVVSQT